MAKILDPDLLTYSVNSATNNLRFDTAAKTIQLVAGGSLVAKDGVTGQCLFSKIKEVIKADAKLIKYALPIREMIHDESMELINGWTFLDSTTIKMVRDCGVAYIHATTLKPTAMFACFVTLGPIPAAVADAALYFTQSNASDATTATFTHVNKDTTFGVNELVKIYSDTNGDGTPDYDYRTYAKVFLRGAGYTFDESSNGDIGYPLLTYKKYNFPITCAIDAGVTVLDGVLVGYTGMSVTWGATSGVYLGTNGPYSYGVTINGNSHTHAEIYSWIQYKLRQSADIDTAGGTPRNGNVAAALVVMDGTTLKTKYQPTVGGVHISNLSASSYNNVAEVDNSQIYQTYPYTAAITLEFDEFLQLDAGVAKFWIYDAATYPGAGATLLTDAGATPMTGTISGPTASFSYAWAADKNWIGIAVGDDDAKIAVASGTIQQSTGNKGVFVAGKERWKV